MAWLIPHQLETFLKPQSIARSKMIEDSTRFFSSSSSLQFALIQYIKSESLSSFVGFYGVGCENHLLLEVFTLLFFSFFFFVSVHYSAYIQNKIGLFTIETVCTQNTEPSHLLEFTLSIAVSRMNCIYLVLNVQAAPKSFNGSFSYRCENSADASIN